MRVWFSPPVFLSLSLLLGGAMPLRAQDDPAPAAPAPAAPAPAAPAPAEIPAETPQNLPLKTPAVSERTALRRAQNEMRLRAMMNDLGIEAAAQQDALIAYLAEDEAGKNAARGAARRLIIAVRKTTPPERMRELLAVYQAALDAERERRRAAQSALDAKIGFSLNPRMEAILWLLGVLGEGRAEFTPRTPAPRTQAPRPTRNAPRDNGRGGVRDGARETGARRAGFVRGVVTRKAEGWIEVRADNGTTDRYLPFWMHNEERTDAVTGAPLGTEEISRANRATLESLARVQIGQRVRLEWAWSERKRVVRLDILPLEPAPPDAPHLTPNNPNQAAPVPTYPAP